MCVSRTGNHLSIDKANFTRKLKQNLNLLVYAFFVKEKNNGALLCACNGSLCHLDLICLQVMTNFNKRIILSVDNISFKNCVKRLCLYKYYHPGTSKADNYSCAYTQNSTQQCISKPQGSQVLSGSLILMPQIKPDHFSNVCLYLSLFLFERIIIRVKMVSPL